MCWHFLSVSLLRAHVTRSLARLWAPETQDCPLHTPSGFQETWQTHSSSRPLEATWLHIYFRRSEEMATEIMFHVLMMKNSSGKGYKGIGTCISSSLRRALISRNPQLQSMYFVERNIFSLMKYLLWKMSILGNDLKLGDIKQQQCILSPFWSLKNHGVGEAALPPWALEDNPVSPLLASSRSPSVLWFVTTLLLSVHGLLCVSVSQISLSFFL